MGIHTRSTTRTRRSALIISRGLLLGALALGKGTAGANPQQVSYWHVGSYEEVAFLQNEAKRFARQSGILVTIQPVPWGHFQTKYFTAMASGAPPDAGSTNLSGPADYGKDGGLVDLGKRFPQAVRRLKGAIFSQMWANCELEGRLFGIPADAGALLGFYRRDIFDRLGLSAPRTWSELVAVIETLNARAYNFGFGWTRNDAWAIGTFTRPFGASALSAGGQQIAWTSEDFQRGYRFAIHLWNSYNLVSEKAGELFALADPDKALPMYFDHESEYMKLLVRAPHLRDKFGVFAFPHPDGRVAAPVPGGRTLVIFRQAKNPAGAMRWIEFVMSAASQRRRFGHLSSLGERSSLALSINREFWRADLGMRGADQSLFAGIYAQLKTEPVYPWAREVEQQTLSKTFYRLKDRLARYLERVASRRQRSVSQLKREFAAGGLTTDKREYRAFVSHEVKRELMRAAKLAKPLLRRDYAEFAGRSSARRFDKTGHWDVLDWAELSVACMLLVFVSLTVLSPAMRSRWYAYLYVAPVVVSALVFVFVPVFVSMYLSFTRYNPVSPLEHAVWVGWDNYARVLSDPILWQSLGRSLWFSLWVLPLQLVLGVVLAGCLDRNLVPDRLYKFVYFAPFVTSIVSVSLIWFALYAGTHYGWVNALLFKLGVVRDPIAFLEDERFFLNAVITVSLWQGLPFYILIFLAGLQNVPREQYEAASIDGAGPLRQFAYVTLPNLKPQFVFLVIMGTIGAVQVFEQIYMLGGGAGESGSKFGPNDSGLTMVPYLYRRGFEYLKMGEASAVAYILFAMLALLTVLQLRRMNRRSANA